MAIRTAAVARLSAWLRQTPAMGLKRFQFSDREVEFDPAASRMAMRYSGAAELLAPWRTIRARVLRTEAT